MWNVIFSAPQSASRHLIFTAVLLIGMKSKKQHGFLGAEAANSNKDRARYEQQPLGKSFDNATTFTFDAFKTRPLDHRT